LAGKKLIDTEPKVEERKIVEQLYNSSRTRAKKIKFQTKCEFSKEIK